MASNCNKTFKSDSELQKHVKIHEGNYWYCDCCKYKSPGHPKPSEAYGKSHWEITTCVRPVWKKNLNGMNN